MTRKISAAKDFLATITLIDFVFVGAALDSSKFSVCLIALIPGMLALLGVLACNVLLDYIRSYAHSRRAWQRQYKVIKKWREERMVA